MVPPATKMMPCVLMFLAHLACVPSSRDGSTTLGSSGKKESPDALPVTQQAVDEDGEYVALARDLESKAEYFETGQTLAAARSLAMEECQINSGGTQSVCVVISSGTTQLSTRVHGEASKLWACYAWEREATSPSFPSQAWLGSEATILKAQAAAKKQCISNGGIDCVTGYCFNRDNDKDP